MEVHKKLGHLSQKSLRYLLNHGMVLGILKKSMNDKISCDACIKSKMTCKPLPKESRDHMKALREQVYSDVWGPARHLTINKKSYYVSFIDNCSRESVIYLMNSKDQVFQKYKLYAAMMLHQQNVHIKTLVSDQGGKYTGQEFADYLEEQGTKHRFTVHDTPESNGIAEHLNRTKVERACAMLLASNLPKSLWGYAVLNANFIKNHTHTSALPDKTPYEVIHHKKPNLVDTYVWG